MIVTENSNAANVLQNATLSSHNANELHESAIPEDVIRERGYRTISDPGEILALGFAHYQCRGTSLLIPLTDTFGRNGRYALKPRNPRVDASGKVHKYEHLPGVPSILDVPTRCLDTLSDASVPLVFTEGAKKADCAAALGYCVIDIWGVHNWAHRDHSRPPFDQNGDPTGLLALPDWEPILSTLDGRLCYLAFDSDASRNAKVALALRRLASFLSKHGACVYIVHLPDEPDGSKNGLDDFVARYGAEAFKTLLLDAEPWGSAATVKKLTQELRHCQERYAALVALIGTDLNATTKAATVAYAETIDFQQLGGTRGEYELWRGQIGKRAGVSDQTVSDKVDEWVEMGVTVKKPSRWVDTDHGRRPKLVLAQPPEYDSGIAFIRGVIANAPPKLPKAKPKPPTPAVCEHPDESVATRVSTVRTTLTECRKCGEVLAERQELVPEVECQPDIQLYADLCQTCGGYAWWLNPHGSLVCARCHPKAVASDAELVF